jgi:ATP-dependent DNA helicase RecG
LHAAGAASFYTLPSSLLGLDRGELDSDRGELDADRGELDADRGELDADRGEPSAAVTDILGRLGRRPRKERLRAALLELCSLRPFTSSELAALVHVQAANLVERHLTPLVDQGRLVRAFPNTPTHPDQRYETATLPMVREPT